MRIPGPWAAVTALFLLNSHYAVAAPALPKFELDLPLRSTLTVSASEIAKALKSQFPNQDLALLVQPYWWWQSGSVVDGLLTYGQVTGDKQYEGMLQNTIMSQATGGNDFMTADATGNDDQAWWALAAMTAAENGLPTKGMDWLALAKNVFNEQKERWDSSRCGGGMKWKIQEGDGKDGWHYKSSIANGLFFQLAARIAKLTGDAEALEWAERAYDWVGKVGLIDKNFNVYDGTDDTKGVNGCVDVNHDQWSYNVGVFLYGSAVLATHTRDSKWKDRTNGFIESAQKTFVDSSTGALFEQKCERDGNCNTDQVSFKGTLARWLGATASVLPETKNKITDIMIGAVDNVQKGWTTSAQVMDHFTALEIVDAGLRAQGQEGVGSGMIGLNKGTVKRGGMSSDVKRRSIVGRIR